MKYLNLVIWALVFTSPYVAYSQSGQVQDQGNWSSASTWVGGTIASGTSGNVTTKTSGNPKFNNGEVLTVDGNYVIGNITFADQTLTLLTTYTLELGSQALFDAATFKNFTSSNNATINVPLGATMIIYGNLIATNGLTLNISGTFIVKGDFTAGNNAGIVVTGSGTIAIDGDLTLGGGTTSITGPPGSITVGGTCTAGNGACGSSALPIELAYFKAIPFDNMVKLNWSTASEDNNDYFTIERTKDGLTYQSIATLSGAGNSSSILEYTYIDKNPIYGRSYYRLKQTDFDGRSETFAPIAVDFTSLISGELRFTNPVRPGDKVTIYTNAEADELLKVSVYNMVGEEIIQREFSSANYSFDLSADVKPGIYFVRVSSVNTEKTGRLLVR